MPSSLFFQILSADGPIAAKYAFDYVDCMGLPRCSAAAVFLLSSWCASVPAVGQVLEVTTHLVQVSVTVQNKQGQALSDLLRDDFTVLDEGRPQEIALFKIERADMAAAPTRRLPPKVFTNQMAATGPGATVILFDGLNTRLPDQAYARQQILKFIDQLKPGDRVALYVMGRGPRVLQDFTNDPQALRRALGAYKGAVPASLEAPLYDPEISGAGHFESWLGELNYHLYDYYGRDRAFRTIRALIAIANHVEGLPGRKNLIWVSGSFPVSLSVNSVPAPRKTGFGDREASPEVERAARALSKAELAIYPVDARGLIFGQEYVGSLKQPEVRNPDTTEFATMQMLAERTGGRAFYNNNDLAGALRRATDDTRVTYLLGYYPAHKDWKGKFRKIEVKVNRPEVDLLYKRGYFAQPDEPSDSWYRAQVLESALWSPVDAAGLALTVQAASKAAGSLELALQVGTGNVNFRRKDDHWECGLDVWLVQLDAKEQQLKTDARVNNLRLDQATFDRARQVGGIALMERLSPAPEAVLLRVLVRDVSTGSVGSLTIPLRRL
ncbi:MAG: VWA domain-containing protein [Bryobacteraceae bacterium]